MNLSTNEIMFNCHIDILTGDLRNETFIEVCDYIDKYYIFDGDEEKAKENYSSDNWEAVYLWSEKFGDMEDLPLLGHHMRNPFDFIFFFYMHHRILGLLFYPLIFLDVVISGGKAYKINQKTFKLQRDTSGKIKAYFKMKVLNMFIAKKIVDYFIYNSSYYLSWLNIFQIYHKNPNNLVRRSFELNNH